MEHPNIVVIVLDSVRYDRTSLRGHHRDTTPNIEKIADRTDGRSFETAMAHTRYTLPSAASILTGKYPGDHGAGFGSNRVNQHVPTVAEAFRAAGYTTALVSNNHFVSPETGLDRGFDTTEVLPKTPMGIVRTVGVKSVATWLAKIRQHSAGFETDKYRHSSAYLMTDLVDQQLSSLEARSDPFFLFAHYNQPHRPYYPPVAWFDKYGDAFRMSRSEAGDFSMEVHNNLVEKVAKGCPFTEDEWAVLHALYDAQIEYTDRFIGELFRRIQRDFDDTIVVITSDHGEHLGERGALGHKYILDDALLHVPLVTSGLEVPSTVQPVQHSDLMCTLLREGGADADFVDGVDLRRDERHIAVSQDTTRSLDPIYEVNQEFDAAKFFPGVDRSLPERTSIRTTTHRYVRGADDAKALFELPDESQDISDEASGLVREFNDELDNWLADHESISSSSRRDSDREISQETKVRLERLGYREEDL
jgi:uncharacterized sulfatase